MITQGPGQGCNINNEWPWTRVPPGLQRSDGYSDS
jgi:hypothetical protein